MKVITECSKCSKDFMYDPNQEKYLWCDPNNWDEIEKNYPVFDDTWKSRRWNREKTNYIDLSGHIEICHECFEKTIED